MESFQIAETLQMIILVAGVALVAFSPIARAVGDWIRHGRTLKPGSGPSIEEGRMDEISGEVSALRQQLSETQERLDFAERLLAQARAKGSLPAGES